MKTVRILAGLVVALGAGTAALAQGYPTKPVRMVVGFTPGGVTDIVARATGQRLSEIWGQPLVVDNRPGAGGVVAAGLVAKSPADGYTLLVHGAFAVNAALYDKLPYRPLEDFVHIGPLGNQPFLLTASTASGVKTVAQLIAAAKARPGQLKYSSVGVGSWTHVIAEQFRLAAGIDAVHVPYKGPEGLTDIIAGRIDYGFWPITSALPHVRDGKLVVLGITSAQRSSLLPEAPPIAEAAVPGFAYTLSIGLWAPARTPADVVDKIATNVTRALAAPELRERFAKLGVEPMSMTPPEFAKYVRREVDDMRRIVKAAGIKPE